MMLVLPLLLTVKPVMLLVMDVLELEPLPVQTVLMDINLTLELAYNNLALHQELKNGTMPEFVLPVMPPVTDVLVLDHQTVLNVPLISHKLEEPDHA